MALVSDKTIEANLKICEEVKSKTPRYYEDHWKGLHEALLKIKEERENKKQK